ncbi:MAG: 16S rRNA (guanine(527)-N(7))-methyltransferase RsmG [Bacteroidota bacterium]|nr:16S rRNA (guanine(527)-N(7))-methyltransferase RsmG [Bacteroidota bacterium]
MDYRIFIPELSDESVAQLGKLKALYTEWNAAINVISRKDMDAFDERHVLHSLALVKAMKFAPGSDVLDVGTGGGFPGIPLAIVYPEVNFVLCDSIGKKMKVVRAVVQALGLTNVTVHHGRAEDINGQFDFVVSRAVTRMNRFIPWVQGKIKKQSINPWPNGILALKGGDLSEELGEVDFPTERLPISEWLDQPFFETKQVVYVKLQ